MLKRVGVLALLLCGGAAFLHPTAAVAQEYRDWNGYGQYRGDNHRYYREEDRHRNWHREREWREQAWRAQEWREHERLERRENGWYPAPYRPAPNPYYGYPY